MKGERTMFDSIYSAVVTPSMNIRKVNMNSQLNNI